MRKGTFRLRWAFQEGKSPKRFEKRPCGEEGVDQGSGRMGRFGHRHVGWIEQREKPWGHERRTLVRAGPRIFMKRCWGWGWRAMWQSNHTLEGLNDQGELGNLSGRHWGVFAGMSLAGPILCSGLSKTDLDRSVACSFPQLPPLCLSLSIC